MTVPAPGPRPTSPPTEVSVHPAVPGDFAEVRGLLQRLDPGRSTERWRPIFDHGWRRPDDPVGFLLRDARGRPVGYLGTILSERTIDGRRERFCNLTSWVVEDAHRGAGALLALALRRLPPCTLTSFTPNAHTVPIFTRLGLAVLDDHWTILPPTLALRPGPPCRVLYDLDALRRRLGEEEARILEDHRPHARHLLAEDRDGACYVVYTLRRRWRLRAARLHYLGDRAVFRRCWRTVQRGLLARHGALLLEADARLLADLAIPGSLRKRMGMPRLCRSALRPEQVTDLYSEVILLGLN